MGCGGSTLENDSPGLVLHKRDKIKIHLHVGKEVKILPSKPQVIVVFGGPGSRKGKLLDDVSHVYGLKLISTETVLLEELSKKIENPNSSKRTEDIASLLKTQPELLRLQLIFSQVCTRIEKEGKNSCILWDFMPNLKFLMSPFRNVKECENDFKIFENKFPISFAINFTVTSEKNILAPQCAVPKAAEQKERSLKVPSQSSQMKQILADLQKELDCMLNVLKYSPIILLNVRSLFPWMCHPKPRRTSGTKSVNFSPI
uniref:Uncharacterized protein LOC111100385 n=1 Tax=Crassostrea virginica TaxID=6565 RepID=A0A8B8A989_CRAVI|nr:uncharacterized protein LOC111100385 [Crassostrea virginica]XP_022288022.1 uncharacterized protein LOC111100385 [Crassostrea virginica]